MLDLKYFFFFFVDFTRSCVSQVIFLALHTSRFLQAIFFLMVRVFFTAFGTCVSSSTGFPMVSIFLAFEEPQRKRDVPFDPLYTIAYLHLLGNVGFVEGQYFFSFSYTYSFYVCDPPVFPGLPTSPPLVANTNSHLVLSFSCGRPRTWHYGRFSFLIWFLPASGSSPRQATVYFWFSSRFSV